MVHYPEVWVADYLQNMRSCCLPMKKPKGEQGSNGERGRRFRLGLTGARTS